MIRGGGNKESKQQKLVPEGQLWNGGATLTLIVQGKENKKKRKGKNGRRDSEEQQNGLQGHVEKASYVSKVYKCKPKKKKGVGGEYESRGTYI